MSRKARKLSLDRITVAFAAPESTPHALDAIARIAAGFEAEVAGVFIEDADMLRAARLPFALEFCRATNVVRRVDSGEIERRLKESAAATRKLIAETAQRTGTRWSFEVIRQRTATAVLELARGTDVTIFSAATSFRYHGRIAPEAAIAQHAAAGESVVVLFDRSAASGRAVQLAHRLAEIRQVPVHAVVVAASKAGLDRLTGQLRRSGLIDTAHIDSLCRPQFSDVAAAAGARHPAAVVLPIALVEGSSDRIHELEEAVENPILIVT